MVKITKLLVLFAVGILAVGGSIASGSGSTTSSGSSADSAGASDEVNDVTVVGCKKDSTLDWGQATVKVKNNSAKASDYSIEVTFTSKDGKTQYGTGLSFVSNLKPGQSKTEKISNVEDVPSSVKCSVTKVDRTEAL